MLVLGEVLLRDTDFHHDLLLEVHSDLLDLSHSLGNHSKILIKILVSLLAIVGFSIFFEILGEFEDFFLGGIQREGKDSFDVFQ